MMKRIFWPLVPILISSMVLQIAASEIILKNGDRLTGKIVEESDDSVVIETTYAGKVKIARGYIERLNTNAAASTSVSADKPVKPAEGPSAKTEPATAPPVVAAKNVDRGLASRLRQFAGGWDGSANVGFNYTSGNSNNITMSTSIRASKISPTDGLTVYIRSLWNSRHGSQSNGTTQNAFWGGGRYDRTIDKRLFGFVSYDFERDRPKKLNFRSVAGTGVGHRTIKNDRTQLEFLVGGAWNRTWRSDGDTNTPEGLVGFTFRHRFTERLKVQNSFTYFQNITDRHEYRSLFDATVSVDLTKRIGFQISVGDRFNNDPIGAAKKNDFLFTTGLKWNFGNKK